MPKRFLLDHNDLLRAFADLRVLRYREAIVGTQRRRAVASFVARRKGGEDAWPDGSGPAVTADPEPDYGVRVWPGLSW